MGLIQRIKKFIRNAWFVDDDRWYSNMLAPETNSGAVVDETTALNISGVWACIKIISEDVASLPLHLYQRLNKGKQRATNRPMYYLLHDRPNPEMSAMTFRETLTAHVLSWGNAYAEKDMDLMGNVKALWPIPPHRVQVYRSNGGQIYYEVTTEPNGEKIILQRDQMLHVPGLSYNGIVGYSVITKHRESIGLALATEEFGARFFGAGTHPGIVVSHPGRLGPDAHNNLKNSLVTGYSGLGKTHRLMLLEEGMKMEKIGIPPEDAQFLQTRKFQIAEFARIYRIPLHMLNEGDKAATFASVEQFSLEYVTRTLRPWLVRFEQAYNWQLLSNDLERRRYFWEHLVDGLLRGDIKSRYEAYAMGRNWGWLSADDIRELENLNPLPDGKGEIYLQPLNMVEAGTPPPEPEPLQIPDNSNGDRQTEGRCLNCHKLLFKGQGAIEIKCPKCGALNIYNRHSESSYMEFKNG